MTNFWSDAVCMWCEVATGIVGAHTPDCKRDVGITDKPGERTGD